MYDLTERVARAIAASKRGLSVDDPEIDRVWSGYGGNAKAAIAECYRWLDVDKDGPPDKSEPIIYARPRYSRGPDWGVGIAYRTVSDKWNPPMLCDEVTDPRGFTKYKYLGPPPKEIANVGA